MTDLSYDALKAYIASSLSIASTDLKQLAKQFSDLYIHFQTDAVKEVTIEPIPNTCFKWVKSKDSHKNKIMIFFHGGGYTMGNTEDHLELIAQLILKTKVTVLSVDYRLYPEITFPAPLEDALSAYQWLLKNNFKSEQIAFSGISAGALLVTQLILLCQQKKISLPKAALVMSGPCNLNFNQPSCEYNANRDWISADRLQNIKNFYLPKENNIDPLLLSPIDSHYREYPATLFQAGDFELLLDDSIHFYEKLRQTNLNVYLNVVSNLPHCWQFFASAYAPGRTAISQAADFINHYF